MPLNQSNLQTRNTPSILHMKETLERLQVYFDVGLMKLSLIGELIYFIRCYDKGLRSLQLL